MDPLNPEKTPSKEEISNAGLIHLLGAFTGILVPIVLWAIHKDKSAFIDAHGKNAVNWHITTLIVYVVGLVASCFFVGYIIISAMYILNIVFSIQAYSQAQKGQMYEYPMTIKFIK